jgi:hypothetical protein
MNRRNFLKYSASLAVLPYFPSWFPAGDPPLVIRREPCTVDRGAVNFVFSKGENETKQITGTGKDLRDYHGLCATFELYCMIKQELEYGHENLKKIYSVGWNNDYHYDKIEKERQKLRNELKVYSLTREEKILLFTTLDKDRGPHPCFWGDCFVGDFRKNHFIKYLNDPYYGKL